MLLKPFLILLSLSPNWLQLSTWCSLVSSERTSIEAMHRSESLVTLLVGNYCLMIDVERKVLTLRFQYPKQVGLRCIRKLSELVTVTKQERKPVSKISLISLSSIPSLSLYPKPPQLRVVIWQYQSSKPVHFWDALVREFNHSKKQASYNKI